MGSHKALAGFGLWACACALTLAQGPPPQTVRQQAEELVKRQALEIAGKREGILVSSLGTLGVQAAVRVRRWQTVVGRWKKDRHAGAAPLVAEGVLLDCLSRLRDVKTPPLEGDGVPMFLDEIAGGRAKRAASAFEKALRIDGSLIEARLRAARIRARTTTKAARELESIAGDPAARPFAYLAAIMRAELARDANTDTAAIEWYRRGLALEPGSAAATIGLSLLSPGSSLPLDTTGAADPYYTYPCTVLTPAVAAELRVRMAQAGQMPQERRP